MANTEGSTSWGQATGTQEGNARTFSDNWTGTGFVSGSGNNEKMYLSSLGYMESEVVNTGINSIDLYQNKYSSGNTGTLKYRSGSSVIDCQSATWLSYSGSFSSLGYTQVRVEAGSNQWWITDGIATEDVIVAYGAKSASSYENSKINLANPGTYDAIDTGHSPDWDIVNGWKFDGISQYLDTNILDSPYPDNYAVIIKFNSFSGISQCALFGISDNNMFFILGTNFEYDFDFYESGRFGGGLSSTLTTSGIRAISHKSCFYNGNYLGESDNLNWLSATPEHFYIGCANVIGDSPYFFAHVYIQSFIMYNKPLNQSQIQAIGAAMP